jgi:hypothetical protein
MEMGRWVGFSGKHFRVEEFPKTNIPISPLSPYPPSKTRKGSLVAPMPVKKFGASAAYLDTPYVSQNTLRAWYALNQNRVNRAADD